MIIILDSTQIEANTRSTHGRGTGRTLDFSDIPVRSSGLLVRKRWIYYTTVPTSEKWR